MASLRNVCDAISVLATAALYPTPPATASTPSPTAGLVVTIGVGWPSPQSLDAIMTAGRGMLTIFPQPATRNTTRYGREWQELDTVAATYGMSFAANVVTLTGAPPTVYTPQNLAIIADGEAYTVQATAGQTSAQLAVALAALIPGATVLGSAITLPVTASIEAVRVGATGRAIRELKRQEKTFQIICWAPTAALRDAMLQVVDPALAEPAFLTMPDGTAARIRFAGEGFVDSDQKQGIMRGDLTYVVEYATTQIETQTAITVITENLENQYGDDLATVTY